MNRRRYWVNYKNDRLFYSGMAIACIEDFVPGKDTSATRQRLTEPDPDRVPESFGISPDGSSMTVAYPEQVFSLMIAEHVPGIRQPGRAR
jgi:hypothetical protein